MAARNTSDVMKLRKDIFMAEQVRWTNLGVSINHVDAADRIDLRTVQGEIAPAEAVLEFVVGEPRSYCLVITHTSARLIELAGRKHVERLVTSYLGAVKAKRSAVAEAKALYAAILGPLRLPLTIAAVTVVRDGPLFLVPIDALIRPNGRYVVERVTVQNAPSGSSIYLERQDGRRREQSRRSLLAVGGVPYASAGLTKGAITRGGTSGTLSNLPASEEELRVAVQGLVAKLKLLLTGRQATEAAFKKADFSNFRFIHLAVHGIADMSFPERAALVMLSDPASGEDGYLQAAEIIMLHLAGQTVVLSACDTAVGPLQGQEGIANIARAFLIAGAREVVSSVWPVDDTASLFLMRSMYQHIAAGMPAPAALAAAKRDMIRKFGRHAAPYLWAGFTADSASRPVARSTSGTRARAAVHP
jgi:CHAT domain-containing protein